MQIFSLRARRNPGRNWAFALIACVCATFGGNALAAASAKDAVLSAHEQRRTATVSGDWAAVASMMLDDLTFTHANAVVENKEQFIGALKSGKLKYQAITDEKRDVRVHATTGVVSGICRIQVNASGTDIDIRVNFTELWVKEGSAWQMLLWHATAVP